MTTFFPHLYEYSKLVNSIKEYEKIDENQNKRKRQSSKKVLEGAPSKQLTLIKNPLLLNQNQRAKDIDFLLYLELKAQKLRESNYNPHKYYDASLNIILKERTELSHINRYQKPLDWPRSSMIHYYQYKMFQYKKEYYESWQTRHWMIIDFVLCAEIAKILPFFVKLNCDDQQALLRSITLLNTLFTQSYYTYTAGCDALIFPDGSIPSMFMKLHNIKCEIFENIVEPIKRISMTKEEYVLLKAIIFCSSKSEAISVEGREILEAEFNRYSKILLNFLQTKHGNAPGALRYSQVISVMESMIYFTQKAKEFYFYVNSMHTTTFTPNSTFGLVKQIVY